MKVKKIVAALALSVLLAAPCAATPQWTDTLTGLLDSILKLPLTLAGLSEEEPSEEPPVSPELLAPESPDELTQTDGGDPDDPSTEKGPKIDVGG